MPPQMSQEGTVTWPPLIRGILIKRYKRFLADVKLDSGEVVTAHCPNTGSMTACCQPGQPVYVSHHNDPKRKLSYTWQLIEMPTSLVGVNTQIPNRLVAQAIQAGSIPELTGYTEVKREVQVTKGTRLDIRLKGPNRRTCFVEVKNCTLVEQGRARFPDAVTQRGAKHIDTLCDLMTEGHRGVMFYLIQRMDADLFQPAHHIDPNYSRKLCRAAAQMLEVLAYDVRIDTTGIEMGMKLRVDLGL